MWKHFSILIFVFALICAVGIAGCIAQDGEPGENNYDISGVGTITYVDLEGGFYGIAADDGNSYLPLNIGEEFKKDGMCVQFTANFSDAVTIYQWGTPIELIGIEEADTCPNQGFTPVTIEESRRIATEYVTNMTEYIQYDGHNLQLEETLTLRCPYCWQFVFTFDMTSMKDPAVTDMGTVRVTMQEGNVISATFSAGKPEPLNLTRTVAVGELLSHPRYDTTLKVLGQVEDLGALNCLCFHLASGGGQMTVWYDMMVEDDGTIRPAVRMEGIENGDWVVVTGDLKSGGTYCTQGDFWAEEIERIPVTTELIPVGTLLAKPVYDTDISVYGEVSLLGELFCDCFSLTSGGEAMTVWYGSMVEDDGTERPNVSVEGVENGDMLVVTGELKSGGIHYSKNDFWVSAITPV
jgi:hypothetical protein